MSEIDRLVDDFLAHHFAFRPVDATFMGFVGHDERLPPADAEAAAREAQELAGLRARLDAMAAPTGGGEAVDYSILQSHLKHRARELAERPNYKDPTFYTGEAAFGVISLLLPSAAAPSSDSLAARLAAIPAFLASGRERLAGAAAHHDWRTRASKECRAMINLLGRGLRMHPLWRPEFAKLAE